MKYDIHVNQRAIIEGGFDLDIIDAAIMDHCRSFSASNSCQFKLENGKRYYWFSHKNICEQLPLLRLKPDSIYRRMKGLCEKNFLEAHPDNKRSNASWYCFLDLADALVSTIGLKSEPSDQNPNPIGSKSEGPSDQNPMYNNNNRIDNNKQQQNAREETADVVDAGFELAKRKINQVREAVLKAEKFKADLCIPARVKNDQWPLYVNTFFDSQIALAETGQPIDYDNLRLHFKNWFHKQIEIGERSILHPNYKPLVISHRSGGPTGQFMGSTIIQSLTSAVPD